ncbi:hypothetical protein V2J94_40145 [Streptomyces sp. DSM 41524]|uniref:Uncharacterized protein n=1 Tax=Streptomyces asiaticus subsp. ignotus TaxID=3098222 RepID=A0ABU7Q9D4_9ACTN|nr:hypothetical protein [Streptomyces sp. DSM 41524]
MFRRVLASFDADLSLYRLEENALSQHAAVLHQRTGGYFKALAYVVSTAAVIAIRSGSEKHHHEGDRRRDSPDPLLTGSVRPAPPRPNPLTPSPADDTIAGSRGGRASARNPTNRNSSATSPLWQSSRRARIRYCPFQGPESRNTGE